MEQFSFPRPKLMACVVALNLVLAALAYYLLLPMFAPVPQGSGGGQADESGLAIAGLVLVLGLLASFASVVLAPLFARGRRSFQDLADAIRQPVILLDSGNRYLLVNREAEKTLGVNRERDIGKSADLRLAGAITDGRGAFDVLDLKGVVEINRRHYQVFDNPLSEVHDEGRRRIVMFLDVENCVRLRTALREINQGMLALNANTTKISGSSVSLSQGATEQATSLAAITSTMDEFSKKIQGNTESAAKSTQLAAQAREAAERSGKEIANALTAMTDVQDAGIRIARIVKLIDDIAFQTNLLALNAAVEAARAGRQGKGFAVVADEVRNLAGRSAKAAKDTASMVEDVTERIGNASAYISKLEEMLRNIVQDAIRMADSSASASTTSAEQAAGILHVNQELGQMNSVTHSTMAAAEQTAGAVEALAKQVEELKRRLDSVGEEFSLQGGIPPRTGPARAINLLDDPGIPEERGRGYSRTDEFPYPEYGRDAAGEGRSAQYRQARERGLPRPEGRAQDAPGRHNTDAAAEWDLAAEARADENDDSLANLLRADGYEQDYKKFLKNTGTRKTDPFGMKFGPIDKGVPETSTPEGDRVVKPHQNIHLDDSEFGRY